MAKIDLAELRKRSDYISEHKHPRLDLLIWNYTHRCQYDKAWDEYTTQARGLITDLEGNIVARPFPKFFNLQEHEGEALPDLPDHMPEVYEKLDGSLGILYWGRYDHGGEVPLVATRGSFTSDQAQWATQWLHKMPIKVYAYFTENRDKTFLFEIIYSDNRIVVNYDFNDLVLLAVRDTETGKEFDHIAIAQELGLQYAPRVEATPQELLDRAKTLSGNDEGWVLKYSDTLRVKVKGEEYVRLHRLLTGFSTTSIWEVLANGENLDELLERVPDEFYEWVRRVREGLLDEYVFIDEASRHLLATVQHLPTRKEQAELLFSVDISKRYSGIVFARLDGKPYAAKIWKMIKPKFAKPFKEDKDA